MVGADFVLFLITASLYPMQLLHQHNEEIQIHYKVSYVLYEETVLATARTAYLVHDFICTPALGRN